MAWLIRLAAMHQWPDILMDKPGCGGDLQQTGGQATH